LRCHLPWILSNSSKWAEASGEEKGSLIATIDMLGFAQIDRRNNLPILPNPFIAILTFIFYFSQLLVF
jgi:hypothetical protein